MAPIIVLSFITGIAEITVFLILPVFQGQLLIDSWYMRRILVLYALNNGIHVIGQVHKDTALYDIPKRTGKRGHPRKCGYKYTPERVEILTEKREHCFIYGKWQWVHYKSVIAKARFLKDKKVRAVWTYLVDENDVFTHERLLLTTDITLTPLYIIKAYAKRWSIETMFAQIKNNWGWKQAWQQSRQTLHRWTQILSVGDALPQLLALIGGSQINKALLLNALANK